MREGFQVNRPPDKTLADYLAIALGPLLIMGLVGSLVFFCLEVAYRGDNPGPIRWTLFWFILAAVLVSRISIENGSTQGGIYGLALGVVTGMMMATYVDWVVGCWVMLALAWWFASKLTWDCTLVEDDEDTSGEGLLEASGLEQGKDTATAASASAGTDIPVPPRASTAVGGRPGAGRAKKADPNAPKVRAHSPGMWVVYFSLAALPLFGVGQLFIPKAELQESHDAFSFVLVYVVCALGLLLSTSFLNLRRYLRQRGLTMPSAMAAGWVGRGVALALVVICAAVLVPRPQARYSLTALLDQVSPQRGTLDAEETDMQGVDRATGRRGDGAARKGEGGEAGASEGGQGDATRVGDGSPGKGMSKWFTPPSSPLDWIRYLIYAAIIAGVGWQIYRRRQEFAAALREIWKGWREFWRKLMAMDFSDPPPVREYLPPVTRATATLDNPFRSGAARQRTLAELADCTLRAAEAYAKDFQSPRREDQTPLEFLGQMSLQWPDVGESAVVFGEVYSRIAYGGALRGPTDPYYQAMEQMWRRLESLTVP